MKLRYSIFALILILVSGISFSQTVTVVSTPDSSPLIPCDFHVHSVDISISSATAGDQVTIEFPGLPSELSILNPTVPIGTNGIGTVSYSGGIVTANIDNSGPINFTLNFEVWGNCTLFNYQNVSIDFDVEANYLTSSSQVSVTHIVNSAVWNMQPISTSIQSLGQAVDHVFEYTNTGPINFNGVVKFSYQADDPMSSLILGTPYHATTTPVGYINPAISGTLISATSNGSLIEVEVDFTGVNVPPNGSIYFVVPVTMDECVFNETDSKGRATALIEYGCIINDLCANNSNDLGRTKATILGPGPGWQLTRLDDNFICPVGNPATDLHQYVARNSGLGNATTLEVQIRNRGSNSISYLLNPNGVSFVHMRGVNQIGPTQTLAPANITANTSIYTGNPTQHTYVILPDTGEEFEPGDEIIITYEVGHECPDPINYATFFANSQVLANDVILGGRFLSDCYKTASHPNQWAFYNYPALACPKPIPGGTQANNNQVGNRFTVNQTWFDPTGPVSGASCGSNLGTNEQREYTIDSGLDIDCMAGNSPLLFVDPEDLIFRVDLEVGCGLDFVPGANVTFQTNDPMVSPQSITGTIISTSVSAMNVETYEVHFTIPTSFWQASSGAPNPPCLTSFGQHQWTSDFSDFFASFQVLFTVEPDCCEASLCNINSGIPVVQSFFINHPGDGQQLCPGTCWLPLSRVQNDIDITCPGCYVPGWNVVGMGMERVNLELADDNDDNIPDAGFTSLPANPSLANIDRVINGDIVKITLDAFLSDGELSGSCDLSMASGIWGSEFAYSQLHLQGDILKDMTFLGATGVFDPDNSGPLPTLNLDIDVDPVNNNFDNYTTSNDFWLQLHASNIQTYSGSSSFTGYEPQFNGDVSLELYFQINTDITSAVFTQEGVNSAMYLSKTDCLPNNELWGSNSGCKIDALTQPCSTIEAMTPGQLDELMLWCVASESSIMNVGFFENSFAHAANAIGTNTCLKSISIRAHEFTGNEYTGSPNVPIDEVNQTQMNCFQFEARRIAELDQVDFPVINGYQLDGVRFYMKNLAPNGSLTEMSCIPFGFPNTPYTITSFTNTGTIYEVDVATEYKTDILPVVCNGVQSGVNVYDETKVYRIVGVYSMVDCATTPTSTVVAGEDVVLHWNNYPQAPLTLASGPCDQNDLSGCPQLGSMSETVTIGNSDVWYKPNNPISLTALNLSNLIPGCDINFDLDLDISGLLGPNQGNQHGYENFFLHFESSCGNIQVNTVDPDWNITPSYNSGSGLWEIGHVGLQGNNTYMGIMNVCADYDCSTCAGQDNTITITYGWDCAGYPTSFPNPNICFQDQITLVIPASDAALQGDVINPNLSWELCSNQTVELELTSTGLDEVINVNVVPNIPAGLTLTGTTTPTFPVPFNNQQSVTYTYDFDVACDFAGALVSFDIDYDDYCGDHSTISATHPTINVPAVSASFSTNISDCDVDFSGSLSGMCSPISWNWDFGDGQTASGQNANNSYTSSGTYPVTLTVDYGTNCTITYTEDVTVSCGDPCQNIELVPVFDILIDDCEVTFDDLSYVSSGWNIIGWSWDFGDGNTSTLQNPVHPYGASGNYTVCLTITAATTINGVQYTCQATQCMDLEVSCKPCDQFEPTMDFEWDINNCDVGFTDLSIPDVGGTIIAWDWNFGDGNTSSLQNPTHTYNVSGTFTVCLTITTEYIVNNMELFCTTTYCQDITVNCIGQCDVSALFDFNKNNCVVDFIDASTITGATSVSYNWNFGDGNTSTLQNPTHTYNTGGGYTVCLTVTGYINGVICDQDTYCQGIKVKCLPIFVPCIINANFTKTPLGNLSYNFFDNSTGTGTPYQWFWDFGDGNTSSLQNPTHMYSSTGPYQVCLTVWATGSNTSCTDQKCKTIKVKHTFGPQNNAPKLAPNPTTGDVTVDFNSEETYQITVMTSSGQTLYETDGKRQKVINLGDYEPGVYLIKMSSAEGTWTERVVKI